jgi:hypothetical protein
MGGLYSTGLEDVIDGTTPWTSTPDRRVLLVTSSHSFDADHDDVADVSANEISQAQREALAGETTIVDDANNRVECDATDTTFASLAAGDTPAYAITYLYNAVDASAILTTSNTLTAPPAPNGGDYVIQWSTEGVWYATN